MSRKAGNDPEETRNRLLAAAVDEFYEYGFEKSSLRHVCARAQVTTGALYSSFKDKEDLFNCIVAPVTAGILNTLKLHFDQEAASTKEKLQNASGEAEDIAATEQILDFYYNNKKIFAIAMSHRDHPTIQHFFDCVTELLDAQTVRIIWQLCPKLKGKDISYFNEYTIHWLSHLQMDIIFHIISHDLDHKQASQQVKIMVHFIRAGLFSLITSALKEFPAIE